MGFIGDLEKSMFKNLSKNELFCNEKVVVPEFLCLSWMIYLYPLVFLFALLFVRVRLATEGVNLYPTLPTSPSPHPTHRIL
jgi:hypothetical protein